MSDQTECTRTERVATGIGTWEGSQAVQSVVKGSQNMPKTENGKEPDESKRVMKRNNVKDEIGGDLITKHWKAIVSKPGNFVFLDICERETGIHFTSAAYSMHANICLCKNKVVTCCGTVGKTPLRCPEDLRYHD